VDARNRLESYCYSAKDAVADSSRDVKASASSLTADDKRAVLDAVQEVLDWLEEEGTSADADVLVDKLKEVSMMPSATQQDSLTAGSPCPSPPR
jgi:molecular chaperone DnaK (HSP70)